MNFDGKIVLAQDSRCLSACSPRSPFRGKCSSPEKPRREGEAAAVVVARSFWTKVGPALKNTAPPVKEEKSRGLPPRDLPQSSPEPESSLSKPEATKPAEPEEPARKPVASEDSEKPVDEAALAERKA